MFELIGVGPIVSNEALELTEDETSMASLVSENYIELAKILYEVT